MDMLYRSDLTGLRALAVVAVVFYHFGIQGFGGGFVGVDIFFVISGYLMTAIVVKGLASGNFSKSAFYLSRAKRIVPALAFLCGTLLILGLFFLGKKDFYSLSKHAVSSMLFLSNFSYKNEFGYFDAEAHEKWLLHTWSLSVEWQFYLLYPLLLSAITRRFGSSFTTIRRTLWLLLAASLAYCMIETQTKPSDAFYMLATRAWELLAGGLVFLYAGQLPQWLPRRTIAASGVLLMVLSILWFDRETIWPGYFASLPVLGACLVILVGDKSVFSNNPFTQAIGKWSYSIYLWHWPIFVAVAYFSIKQTGITLVAMVTLAILLGYLSYRFVEEPFRHSGFAKTLTFRKISFVAAPMLALGVVGIASKGLPARLPQQVVFIESDPSHVRGNPALLCDTVRSIGGASECVIGKSLSQHAVALIGDSHAGALLNAFKTASQRSKVQVLAYPGAACAPLVGIKRISGIPGEQCRRYVEAVEKRLEEHGNIGAVVYVVRWSVYLEGYTEERGGPYAHFEEQAEAAAGERRSVYRRRLLETICQSADKRPTYVVLPIPEQGRNVPREMARKLITGAGADSPGISLEAYQERNALVLDALHEASTKCGVRTIDPTPYLCADGWCHGAINSRPAYYDDDHLNEYGSQIVLPMLSGVDVFGRSVLTGTQ